MHSYVTKNINLRRSILKKNVQLNNFTKKNIVEKIDELNFLNINEKSFCKLILKTKYQCTNSDKLIARNIYYRSPSIIRYMKDSLNLKLPAVKTILSWSKIKFIKPDINEEVIKIIMKTFFLKTFLEREKQAILTFDEISIKKSFVYNIVTDEIDGFEQIGTTKKPVFYVEGGFYRLENSILLLFVRK